VVQASGGADGPPALRRLNAPRRVELRVDGAGLPNAVRRGERWLAVEELLDRYRTDDRWWTQQPIVRAYYDLLLEDGRALTVFRDETDGLWWEQRYG
jgi:hypothetical protein